LTVLFFISGHGFGHASRQVEIIHALAALRPDARILVRSAVSPALLERTIEVPFELRAGPCDTGIVQSSSVSHDDPATVREAIAFYSAFDARIKAEVEALDRDDVALIVGDIAPVAFEVAERLNVPGVAIANFTWDWIYETHPGMTGAAPWLVPRLRRAYERATVALKLPFAGGFEVFRTVRPLPLVARRHTRSRSDTRERFGIPQERPALLLSFGGYGLPDLDLASLDVLADWTIVTTDRSSRAGATPAGVVFVPEQEFIHSGFRYEDLVAAVDAVVSKPGYGIIAECIAAGSPLLYTSRGEFREYDVLVEAIPRYLRSQFIDQPALFSGRWARALRAMLAQPAPSEQMATNGAEVAAAALSDWLAASR